MGRPCSNDLRALVVAEILGGSSIRAAARRLRVSVATAVRCWHRCRLRDGNAEALKMGGDRRSHKSEPHIKSIVGQVVEQPCLTSSEIRERLVDDAALLTISTIWRVLIRAEYTRKKTTRHAGGQDRPDVQKLRKDWKAGQPALPVGKPVFLDECSVGTNMARSHGWS